MGCHFWMVTERLWSSSYSQSLTRSLWGSQLPCLNYPMGRPTWQGTEGSLQQPPERNGSSQSNSPRGTESCPQPQKWAGMWLLLQMSFSGAAPWVLLCAALSQRRPAKLGMYSWHTSCETVFVVLEKLRVQEQILNIASNVFPLVRSFWPSDNLLKEAKLLFEKWKFNCHFPIEIFKLLPIAVGFWVLRT